MENLEFPRTGMAGALARTRLAEGAHGGRHDRRWDSGVCFGWGVLHPSAGARVRPSALAKTAEVAAPSPKLLSESHQFSFADLVERVSPAVVSVQVDMQAACRILRRCREIPAPFRDFFRDSASRTSRPAG